METIPKVASANSTEEYRQAVGFMLSFLNDPNTHVIAERSASSNHRNAATAAHQQPHVRWIDERTAMIVANDYAYFEGSSEKAADLDKVFAEGGKAKAVIIDCRNRDTAMDEDSAFWYAFAFRTAVSELFEGDRVAASSRTRMFSGYPTQVGGYSGYYSAFVTQDGATIHGRAAKDQNHRLVFLVNAKSLGFDDILGGLQSAGLATVIQEGAAGEEGGAPSFTYSLPEHVSVSMRTGEVVNPDGTVGFHPDIAEPESAEFSGDGNKAVQAAIQAAREAPEQTFTKPRQMAVTAAAKLENRYADMKYPSKEYRLLGLFRFWNVMFYFHPYRYLYDHPWDQTLTDFIPQFEADRDALEYSITTARLVARIDDSHGYMRSSVLQEYIGTGGPPVTVESIQGETIVTRIYDEGVHSSSGLAIGDVILSVDGEDIKLRRNRLGELFAASTPQALRIRVSRTVLSGPKGQPARLKIRDAAGQVKDISVTRASNAKLPQDETPVFRVLPEGFGYIDLTRLHPDQVQDAFEAIRKTPALIFDMRGYPNGVFELLGARFAEKRTVTAVFRGPTPESPDPTEDSRILFHQYAEPDSSWKYRGRVVVLINEKAISQAEHTCLFLEATAHAKFIGSPTQGANGDVTQTVLPGDIVVNFSGHDVRHADGRQLQRVGIQPDIKIEPTIEGVREGRDEVLGRAISYLKNGK